MTKKLIISNERDQRAAEWLVATFGQGAVDEAVGKLAGNRKPYISNIAKILGVEIPTHVVITQPAEAKQHLAQMRQMISQKIKPR